MNLINIDVEVKGNEKRVSLVLYHRIYSTPDGIINRWATREESDYKVEILIDGSEVSFDRSRIVKDLNIISSEHELLDQMMSRLFEKKILEKSKF